jgi:hypothetical protein
MTESRAPKVATWLRVLSGLMIALMLAALLYASVIGLINFPRIGV